MNNASFAVMFYPNTFLYSARTVPRKHISGIPINIAQYFGLAREPTVYPQQPSPDSALRHLHLENDLLQDRAIISDIM